MPKRWGGRYVQRLNAAVLQVYGTTCHLCGRQGADTTDHIIPRSKGGTEALENCRPAHHQCNSQRQDMDLRQWFATHPIRRPSLAPSSRWTQ